MATPTIDSILDSVSLTDTEMVAVSNDDIPRLVDIHVACFAKSKYVQLTHNENEHRDLTTSLLNSQTKGNRSVLLACQDRDSKDKLGWLSYSSFKTNSKPRPNRTNAGPYDERIDTLMEKRVATDFTFSKNSRLTTAIRSNVQQTIEKQSGTNRRCFYINTLAVDPIYSSKGVERRMISWIAAQADAVGADCWVQSSPADWRTYFECGFTEVDHFDLDRAAFGPEFDPGEVKFLTFRFFYMVRRAQKKDERTAG